LRGPITVLKRVHKRKLSERIDAFEHGAAISNPSLEHVHGLVVKQKAERAALRLHLNQNRIARAKAKTNERTGTRRRRARVKYAGRTILSFRRKYAKGTIRSFFLSFFTKNK